MIGGEDDGGADAGGRRRARADGIDASGPWPADTVFGRAARGEFDAVIACYHDQGLIPVKLLAFGRAVNVTLGLPIVRTSVDHGTAFDIAGTGVADPSSLVEAILLAARLAGDGSAMHVMVMATPVMAQRPRAKRLRKSSPTIARRITTTSSSKRSRRAWRCSAPR